MPEYPKISEFQPEVLGDDYYGLPLETLQTDAILECQMFLQVVPGKFVKYREQGLPFDASVRKRLKENKHTHIYIRTGDGVRFQKYLEENLHRVLNDPRRQNTEKTQILYSTTTYTIKTLLANPRAREAVVNSKAVVELAVEYIFSQPKALRQIIDISEMDYYTYTHSVHVMTFTIALAKRLGWASDKELFELGCGGLFHDVGKSFVDPEILNKNGPLTDEEFEHLKKHPEYGYKALRQTDEVSERILMPVLRHHERLDGHGYPSHLSEVSIEPAVRIVSVADMYDALTTRRVYRDAYLAFDALQIMKELVGTWIDPHIFREFVKMLGET